MHRLVQEITRARLSEAARGRALRAAVAFIDATLPAEPPPSDVRAWPIWNPLRSHIELLVRMADESAIPEPTARLMNELGQYLYAKSLLQDAEPLMRRALVIDEASYGLEHPKVAIRLNNLAQLLQATNRLDEAEPLGRRALEIVLLFQFRTGHEHPKLNTAFGNYRGLLAAMGHDEGEQQASIDSLIESIQRRFAS